MEFIDGENLAAWLRRHGPPVDQRDVLKRLQMLCQAGEGLAAAHAAGIIHRDFKPENILRDHRGGIHVADFGLARREQTSLPKPEVDDDADAPQALARGVTNSRAMLGTPGYMAPEQIDGGSIDVRTDIFAFCVSLFEVLYDMRPFDGRDVDALARAMTAGEVLPPPPEACVAPWIDQHIRRGLHPDPDQRWPTMRALLDALGDNPAHRRRKWLQWSVGVILVFGLSIAACLNLRRVLAARDLQVAQHQAKTHTARTQRDAARASEAEAAVRARDHLRMAVLRDTVDPTTTLLILAEVESPATTEGFAELAHATLQVPVSRAILRGKGSPILSLNFLDEGRFVAAHSRDGLLRAFRYDGRGPTSELDLGAGHGNAVRLGERRLAVPMAGHKIGVVDFERTADDGWRLRQTFATPFDASYLAVDPTYQRLAAIEGQTSDAVVFDLKSGTRVGTFSCGDSGLWHVDLSPGGHAIVLTSNKWETCYESVDRPGSSTPAPRRGTGVFHPQDRTQLLLIGGSGASSWSGQRRAPARPLFTATDMFTWSLDPGGTFIVGNTPKGQIARHPLDGTPAIDYGIGGRGFGTVEVSPDGAWIAAIDRQEIVVWATGRPERRATLTLPEADRSNLIFSDQSERLASAGRWGDVHVWELASIQPHHHLTAGDTVIHTVAASDTMVTTLANDEVVWWQTDRNTPLRRLNHPESVIPAVSDDGTIGVIGTVSGRLLVGDRDGNQTWLRAHTGEVWDFDFSPDGKWLLTGSEDATARVWDLESHELAYTLEGHHGPLATVSLGPNGHRAATVGNNGSLRLWSFGRVRSPVANVLHPPNPQGIARVSFSPDGRWLLASSHGTTAYLWDLLAQEHVRIEHTGVLTQACWDPQNRWVATATRDGTVRRWHPETTEVLSHYRHPGAVENLVCASDGNSLATTSGGVIRHFLVGEEGTDQLKVGASLVSIAYTTDNLSLYYGTRDGVLSRWTPRTRHAIPPKALLGELRAATTACLTVHQRQWILRESQNLARQQFELCERSFGREPPDT